MSIDSTDNNNRLNMADLYDVTVMINRSNEQTEQKLKPINEAVDSIVLRLCEHNREITFLRKMFSICVVCAVLGVLTYITLILVKN
jgi:hypothetical protein